MTTRHKIISALAHTVASAAFVFLAPAAWSLQVVGPIENGTVSSDPAEGVDRATDHDSVSYMQIDAAGGPGNRVSFIVDLEAPTTVRGVAIYGLYRFEASQLMLSNVIQVEAATSLAGPYTVIGSIDVGSTPPTGPNPATDGVNPFTGGNGRLITTTPTAATHIRISGDQAFNNTIRISEIHVNPRMVLHQVDPPYQVGQVPGTTFDVNGGLFNGRGGPDLVDQSLISRAFIQLNAKLTFDIGAAKPLRYMNIYSSEGDSFANIRTGNIRVSSTDNPSNMDTLVTNFDTQSPFDPQLNGQVPLTGFPNKRYIQLEPLTSLSGQTGTGAGPTYRVSEIDYVAVTESQIEEATVVVGSVVGGTVNPNEAEPRGSDKDVTSWMEVTGTAGTPMSFKVDLGGTHEVRSIALYGRLFYNTDGLMLSNNITVEAANSVDGVYTQIGSLNVGSVTTTDPNPAIGGENKFTGGNGRRIVCTPTNATHLRITGDFPPNGGVNVGEVVVNPKHVLHTISPVEMGGGTTWDYNGGTRNARAGNEAVDGNFKTRLHNNVPTAWTLDIAPAPVKIKEIRALGYDNDLGGLPDTGSVRISSTDSPTNMDTPLQTDFAIPYPAAGPPVASGGAAVIPLPTEPTVRYVQVSYGNTRFNPAYNPANRFSELQVVPVDPFVQGNSSVADWSVY